MVMAASVRRPRLPARATFYRPSGANRGRILAPEGRQRVARGGNPWRGATPGAVRTLARCEPLARCELLAGLRKEPLLQLRVVDRVGHGLAILEVERQPGRAAAALLVVVILAIVAMTRSNDTYIDTHRGV